jgi:hypothetical protein
LIKYFGASIKRVFYLLEVIVSFDKDYPLQDSLISLIVTSKTYIPHNILSVGSTYIFNTQLIQINFANLRVDSNSILTNPLNIFMVKNVGHEK